LLVSDDQLPRALRAFHVKHQRSLTLLARSGKIRGKLLDFSNFVLERGVRRVLLFDHITEIRYAPIPYTAATAATQQPKAADNSQNNQDDLRR